MSEEADVLAALGHWRERPAALATVVGVEGSTYRKPGARTVVPLDGDPVGTISGGCLEPAVLEEARRVVSEYTPRLVRYDLTGEEEALVGWKLGCQGRMELLIEPLARTTPLLEAARRVRAEGVTLALITAVEISGNASGRRCVVEPDGRLTGSLGDPALDAEAVDAARAVLRSGGVRQHRVANGDRILIEVLEPPLRLVVCGAGDDARPVVEFAIRLGWRVEVVDHREARLGANRFAAAAHRIVLPSVDELNEQVRIDDRTYVLLITHDYQRDKQLLRALMPGPAPYVGIVGPRARRQRLLDELASEGLRVDDAMRRRLHGPAGLDLGAEGPEEIAWSIVAEILAVSRGRSGESLRDAADGSSQPLTAARRAHTTSK